MRCVVFAAARHEKEITQRTLTSAGIIAALFVSTASAETFCWSSTTDPQTMPPHAVNSASVLAFCNNVYEGLVRRGNDMAIEPALGTSWHSIGEGEGWRFNLREGVTFHDGSAFNADDVIFSYERATSEAADTRSWFTPVDQVAKINDFTVDIYTTAPNRSSPTESPTG